MRALIHIVRCLRGMRRDEGGTVAVEAMLVTPLLILGLFFSYEAYGFFRQQSLREKATYTVADILSRETAVVTDTYVNNVKTVFDIMAGTSDSQLRISTVRYRDPQKNGNGYFELRWSEVRGEGQMAPLTNDEVVEAFDTFPVMQDGEEIIYVESRGTFSTVVRTGVFDNIVLTTEAFMIPRFAPQICYTGVCVPHTS